MLLHSVFYCSYFFKFGNAAFSMNLSLVSNWSVLILLDIEVQHCCNRYTKIHDNIIDYLVCQCKHINEKDESVAFR